MAEGESKRGSDITATARGQHEDNSGRGATLVGMRLEVADALSRSEGLSTATLTASVSCEQSTEVRKPRIDRPDHHVLSRAPMHWILQKNLINPADLDRFETALRDSGTSYSLISLVPFFHELADEPADLPADGLFVYGSTGLGHVAKTRGWQPGYFDENLDYELMLRRYGSRALNANAICASLAELQHQWDRFFIRPTLDNKSFAGTVMTWHELEEFREGVARVFDAPDVTLRLEDRVVMAPLTSIEAEFRLFAIGGRIVTGSRYKVGERLSVSEEVPSAVKEFAQDCVYDWAPNAAFTIDIAIADGQMKIIELNSANSAGVYASDVGALVDAVNARL
ncbi:hypothetical protein CDL60_11185 [Roseateles noduli]|nr:hypothetical protein CDL60_11185 [Roseateles noduli]